MHMTKGINDQYFALFKMQLALFIKANYNPCSGFIQGIEKATDASNLTLHFSKNADSILEHLGGGNSENKISKLESEISNLSDECNEFYNKLEILEGIFGPTLNNEFMREHYAMYAHNFQEWELEELLKNGKE